MMICLGLVGWALAIIFCSLYLDAVKKWDYADNELTYLQWQERMRKRREAGEST